MTHKIQENPAQNFIICLLESHAETAGDLSKAQREESRKHNHGFFQKDELITAYRALIKTGTIKPNQKLEKLLRLKETRSFSGIVVVSVLTKPFPCPGNCLYCPTQKKHT